MLPEAESFEVAVAAFSSATRADDVVRSLRLLDLPAYVQPSAGGLHAVAVGPFASRDEAKEAQAQIASVHLADSRIVTTGAHTATPAAASVTAVATTGQKGQP